ncbi:MAG: hypothetical protein AAFQ37_10945 [Bacteroidota bacterium]
MPKYDAQKFEVNTAGPGGVPAAGTEQIVYWQKSKHHHDATLITQIEIWLGQTKGGTWKVRLRSYQPGLSSPPSRAIEFA